jgi:hypothetical protein
VSTFEEFQRDLAPPWLQGPHDVVWLEAHGARKDALVADYVAAIEQGSIQYGSETALALKGAERGLSRFPGEPLEAFRRRVLTAWEFWSKAGTLAGVEYALTQAGFPPVVTRVSTYDPTRWAEFDVRVDTTSTPDAQAVTRMTGLINQVKPSSGKLAMLLLIRHEPDYFGFAADPNALGFGDANNPAVGGVFAEVIP